MTNYAHTRQELYHCGPSEALVHSSSGLNTHKLSFDCCCSNGDGGYFIRMCTVQRNSAFLTVSLPRKTLIFNLVCSLSR